MVLPPGAAQRSITFLPATSPSISTGKVAAASCTHQPPSAKPGISSTRPSASTAARQAEQVCAGRRHRGGIFQRDVQRCFALMRQRDGAGGLFAILRQPALPQPVGRVQARRVQPCRTASPSRAIRRSTALISGLKCTAFLSCGGQLVGGIHRGMRRNFQDQQFRTRPAAESPSPVPPCAAAAAWARTCATTASSSPKWRKVLAGQRAGKAGVARRQSTSS